MTESYWPGQHPAEWDVGPNMQKHIEQLETKAKQAQHPTLIWPSQRNLAPIWKVQSGANLEFRPIWHLANNNFQSGNG